jgi:hypothetical protein
MSPSRLLLHSMFPSHSILYLFCLSWFDLSPGHYWVERKTLTQVGVQFTERNWIPFQFVLLCNRGKKAKETAPTSLFKKANIKS